MKRVRKRITTMKDIARRLVEASNETTAFDANQQLCYDAAKVIKALRAVLKQTVPVLDMVAMTDDDPSFKVILKNVKVAITLGRGTGQQPPGKT